MRGLIALALVAACSAGAPGPGIDTSRVLAHVATLAAAPRPGDTQASAEAATYIEGQLAAIGVPVERMPVGGVDLPAIDVLGVHWRDAKHVDTIDPDLIVRLGPQPEHGRALLVMAHYDTVPASPGAVDNAAAVGVLIELARVLHDQPPPQPVMLVFTANEERGLIGAEALAERHGDEVEFAIALDLIGGSGPLVLNGASELIGARELHWLADAARRAGVVLRAPLPHRVISRWWPQAERSDHGAFTRRGIRAVHFYDRGQDGEWIDLAYHSPADVPARVDRDSIDEIGRLLRALAASPPPARGSGDAGFWLPLAVDTVVPRWLLIAVELALALGALAGLVAILRGGRDHARGAGLLAGIACYALAAGAAIAAERVAAGAHPAPWLHGPLRAELAELLVLAGALGLATRVLARRWRWKGEGRFLAVAIALPLAIGTAALAIGAAELAWIWLVPAALAALAPRLPRPGIWLIGTLLPAVLVLAPAQLREAAWNGFLPQTLPLAAWLAVFLAAPAAGLAWVLRRSRLGPLGTLVLPLGSVLAVAAGIAVLLAAHPACSPANFHHFHLACELHPTWR